MNVLIIIAVLVAVIIWLLSRKKPSDPIEIHLETVGNVSNGIEPKKYESIDEWKSDLVTLWEGPPLSIEFTYESRNGKMRRTVTIKRIAKNNRNELYLIGTCHTRNEERTFNFENIVTLILYKSKRYHHYDFLTEVIGIDATGYSFYC